MVATQSETRALPLIQLAELMRERARLACEQTNDERSALETIQAFARIDATVEAELERGTAALAAQHAATRA